eukprot:gnl/TRDRNA2_/TRDRNA2_174276_c1_seq4.p1 gnl/TRDRNA2_/TRDRNA2_174276_c1~~gnl/TRDRNA2_/TRDRNA2_174276_c1_seq4.p1  ORF type:complete len:291 (-),score=86.38 gnl/TRDRNA2_/TRDRNA2_174276_c1_seq4:75-947(-)
MLQVNSDESSEQSQAVKARVLENLQALQTASTNMIHASTVTADLAKQFTDNADSLRNMEPEEFVQFAEDAAKKAGMTVPPQVQQVLDNPTDELVDLYERGSAVKDSFFKNHNDEIMLVAKQLNKFIHEGLADGSISSTVDNGLKTADQIIGDGLKKVADEADSHAQGMTEDEKDSFKEVKDVASFFQKHIHEYVGIVRASLAQHGADAEQGSMLQTAVKEHDQVDEAQESAVKAKILKDLEYLESMKGSLLQWAERVHAVKQSLSDVTSELDSASRAQQSLSDISDDSEQ